MAVMKLSIILSCIFVMVTAEDLEKDTPVYLCGRQLANARVSICYGKEYLRKKSLPTFLERSIEKWHEGWPWIGRRGALSANWARYKREEGLADLCCLKPCTAEVILNYC